MHPHRWLRCLSTAAVVLQMTRSYQKHPHNYQIPFLVAHCPSPLPALPLRKTTSKAIGMAAGGGGGSVPRDPTEAVLHGVAIVKASGSGEPLVLSIAHNTSQFSFFAFGASST